jgi:hypothetical protein
MCTAAFFAETIIRFAQNLEIRKIITYRLFLRKRECSDPFRENEISRNFEKTDKSSRIVIVAKL